MDAIALLKQDHREVEALFKQFEKASHSAMKRKRDLVEQMVEELCIHSAIEQAELYPTAKEALAKTDAADLVSEALEEHHLVEFILGELDQMTAGDNRFEAKVQVLMENVRHHVEEEEKELFPALRKAMARGELVALGGRLEAAKRDAPTQPPEWARQGQSLHAEPAEPAPY